MYSYHVYSIHLFDHMQVTWLASWTDNIQGQIKYIMLNPTSRLKVGVILIVVMVTFAGVG